MKRRSPSSVTHANGATEPFSWATDEGTRRYRLDKFMDVARTVAARRGAEVGPAAAAALARLHAELPG